MQREKKHKSSENDTLPATTYRNFKMNKVLSAEEDEITTNAKGEYRGKQETINKRNKVIAEYLKPGF